MKLELTTAWTKLNDKFTNKFGAFVRHGSDVEITYETTPVASTQGKVYSLHQTIKVDPAIDMYVRSLGKESVLTLDENFYEEDGSSSSSDNINLVPVIFKIEEEQDWNTGGSFVPVLNIYEMDGTTKLNPYTISQLKENKFRFKGKISDIVATYLTTGLSIYVNNSFVQLFTFADFQPNGSSAVQQLYANQLGLNIDYELMFQITTSPSGRWIIIPSVFNIFADFSPTNVKSNVSYNDISSVVSKATLLEKNQTIVYLDSSFATSADTVDSIDTAWKTNKTILASNFKITDSSSVVLFDAGSAKGTMFIEPYVDSTTYLGMYAKIIVVYEPSILDGLTQASIVIPLVMTPNSFKLDNTYDIFNINNWTFKKGTSEFEGVAEIECKFKIEHKQYEDEGTTYDVPSLEIYDFNDQPIIFDITKKYFGIIESIESFSYPSSELRLNVNNDYYYIEASGFSETTPTTSDVYLEAISLNQYFGIRFENNSDKVLANTNYLNILNLSESITTNVSKGQVNNLIETRTNTAKRSPNTFNANNITTNDNLLIFLASAWYTNNKIVVRNLKFPNYDFAGASGNIYGNMYFDFVRSSINVPIEAYFLKVTITFQSPVNNISKLERFFSLNFNNATQKYTISKSEIFYDESKWKFYGVGRLEGIPDGSPLTLAVGDNILFADNKIYNRVLLKVERVGVLYGDWLIDLDVLRLQSSASRYLHFSISDMWFSVTIDSSNNIIANLDGSQTSKGTLRVNQLTFFGV